ncbi:hypothetical protein [Bacillus sp. P14.5]|uniref:hypothetical protein n=1 Tax=Bacillus sp. P14.5 TaxID=1983400 RepID=UPI000DEBAF9B|nr:hypothetical protein [Bacillus sp. P14.5]
MKNKRWKIILGLFAVLLAGFQAAVLAAGRLFDVHLVYEWIFYANNYILVVLLLLLAVPKNVYALWTIRAAALMLLVSNTTFYYYMGNINVVVSKPEDGDHTLILKEYENSRYETVRLKPLAFLFGRETAVLKGSSEYKAIQEGEYNVEWVSGDSAIITYKTEEESLLEQDVFNFRDSDYVSYQYALVALTGKWYEKDNPDSYFMVDQGEILYAKDGELHYYSEDEAEQQGIFSLVFKGADEKPSFTIILNSDAEYGEDGLIKKGGTITISPADLNETEGKVYLKEENQE